MAKNWITQTELATELNLPYQNIHHWVVRGAVRSKIHSKTGKLLVDRTTVRVRAYAKRRVKKEVKPK